MAMTNEELVALIQAGERDRLEELWAQEERLVLKYAYSWYVRYEGRGGVTIEDLVQHGFIAMAYAAVRIDLGLGYKFNSYFVPCLKTEFAKASGLRTRLQQMDPIHGAKSLDAPASNDSETDSLGTFIPDPSAELMFDECERNQALRCVLQSLTERERRVIVLRFFCDLSVERAGKEMGITKSSAHRLEAKALRKLRHPRNIQRLSGFV